MQMRLADLFPKCQKALKIAKKDNWRAGWGLAIYSPKEDKENLCKDNKGNSEVAGGQITSKRHTKNKINKIKEKYQLRR